MSDKTVVLALFHDELAADSAAASLNDSGVAQSDVIGILVADEKGKLKTEKVGQAQLRQGAGIGAVLALRTPIGLGDGLLGALHHKGLRLDQADRDRIGGELAGGKAAVGVLAPISEASYVAAQLSDLGGTAETDVVTDEAL